MSIQCLLLFQLTKVKVTIRLQIVLHSFTGLQFTIKRTTTFCNTFDIIYFLNIEKNLTVNLRN